MSAKNGVDVERLGEAIEAITGEPENGRFEFRAETEWTGALQCVTSIDDFDQAGERIHTREFRIESTSPLMDNLANEVTLETDVVVS